MNELEKDKNFAEHTRNYVIQFLLNFDRYIFDEEGPQETFFEFLCHYGYKHSDFIMAKIVPTGVFNEKELKILTKIEDLMAKILSTHRKVDSWNNLNNDEYLALKLLSHEYLTIVYNLNDY